MTQAQSASSAGSQRHGQDTQHQKEFDDIVDTDLRRFSRGGAEQRDLDNNSRVKVFMKVAQRMGLFEDYKSHSQTLNDYFGRRSSTMFRAIKDTIGKDESALRTYRDAVDEYYVSEESSYFVKKFAEKLTAADRTLLQRLKQGEKIDSTQLSTDFQRHVSTYFPSSDFNDVLSWIVSDVPAESIKKLLDSPAQEGAPMEGQARSAKEGLVIRPTTSLQASVDQLNLVLKGTKEEFDARIQASTDSLRDAAEATEARRNATRENLMESFPLELAPYIREEAIRTHLDVAFPIVDPGINRSAVLQGIVANDTDFQGALDDLMRYADDQMAFCGEVIPGYSDARTDRQRELVLEEFRVNRRRESLFNLLAEHTEGDITVSYLKNNNRSLGFSNKPRSN